MRARSKRSWLFAFCDLAFLLLISLSLIPSGPAEVSLRLAEMELPEIPDNRNLQLVKVSSEVWELRIFEVSDLHPLPYELKRGERGQGLALDHESLMPALQRLGSAERPQLMPEKRSLSQDLLFAAAAVARVWSEPGGRAVVRPLSTGGSE